MENDFSIACKKTVFVYNLTTNWRPETQLTGGTQQKRHWSKQDKHYWEDKLSHKKMLLYARFILQTSPGC